MKRYAIATSLALIMLSSSPTSHTPMSNDDPIVIKSIPPTFITLDHIPECIESDPFPQVNPLPYFNSATQTQFSCDFYEKDHLAWVLYIFYELWEREFGDPGDYVKIVLNQISIEWGEEVMTVDRVYDINGNFLETASVTGLVVNDTSIWVWVEGNNISDTSLVHELTHIALRHTCGDADADHEGVKYSCWYRQHSKFIDSVNTVLREIYGL